MTAIQCQARISAQRQCTKTTNNPDGMCHQHTGGQRFNNPAGGSRTAIPPIGGAKVKEKVDENSEPPESFSEKLVRFNLGRTIRNALFNPSPEKIRDSERFAKDAIMNAIPPEWTLYYKSELEKVKDKEKLGLILELSKAFFPNGEDPNRLFTELNRMAWADKNTLKDMVALKEPLADGSLGPLEFDELRGRVQNHFGEDSEDGETAPNIAAHYKAQVAVDKLSDNPFLGYWIREGVADRVNANPEQVDEIIRTLPKTY